MTILYPIRYQDSVDLEGDNDDIITLLNPPEQRMLQSILNNVESNPDIFIVDYFDHDTDVVDEFLSGLMLKLMSSIVIANNDNVLRLLPATRSADLGGAVSYTVNTNQHMAGYFQTVSTINGGFRWENIFLQKGTYQLWTYGVKSNNSAIWTLRIDTVSKATIDYYNATSVMNSVGTAGAIVVDASDYYDIEIIALSRNASNTTGYFILCTFIELRRTGD